MNYKVIADETILDDFIESLTELKDDEVFYMCLFARSKYLTEEQKGTMSHIKSDKAQLKRVICNKKTMKNKLMQMECPLGSYVQYKTNVPDNPVPQEALAVYLTINPRSLRKATGNSLSKFVDMLVRNDMAFFNPSNFAMSEIQRSVVNKKPYAIFDIDEKFEEADLKERIKKHLGDSDYRILETRGGYHIIVSLQNIDSKIKSSWYLGIQSEFGEELDQAGDIMIPIPGTYQGMFIPKFI